MPINRRALTKKYFVRLAAAMFLEARGYAYAVKKYRQSFADFDLESLDELEKAFLKIGTLHARGVAQRIRELKLQVQAA